MSHRKKLEALADRRTSSSKELDPELADGFGDSAVLSKSSRRGDVDATKLDAAKPGKRSKLRAEAHMREVEHLPKYRGAVVSRPKYQEEEDESEDVGEGAASDSDENDDDEGLSASDSGEDDSEDSFDAEDNDGTEQSDDSESEGGVGHRRSSGAAGLAADVDAELHALERSDGQALLAASRQTASDAQQGMAVRQQLGACTLALETRVRLQPLVAAAARFPGPEAHAALCAASAPLAQSFAALRGELASLLRDLITMQAVGIAGDDEARPSVCAALRIADPAAAAAGAAGARKRRRPVDDEDDDDDDSDSGAAAGGSPVAARRAAADAIVAAVLPKPQPRAAAAAATASGKKKARIAAADAGDADGADAIATDALWSGLTALDAAASKTRNETLNGWARRLAYSGGVTARKAGKLKVLAADLTAQVDDLLRSDAERLLARTRPRADAVAVLGERHAAPGAGSGAAAPGSASGSADAGADADGSAAASVAVLEHAFDDGELYTALLRELVAAPVGASAAAGAAGGALASAAAAAGVGASAESLAALLGGDANAAAALLLKHKSVKRAGIDRRATKGRRLKFTAMPKLVGFMAPAPYVVPPDRAFDLDTLVASLFKSTA